VLCVQVLCVLVLCGGASVVCASAVYASVVHWHSWGGGDNVTSSPLELIPVQVIFLAVSS